MSSQVTGTMGGEERGGKEKIRKRLDKWMLRVSYWFYFHLSGLLTSLIVLREVNDKLDVLINEIFQS